MPLALRTMLTWLVIGPVSSVFNSANGGCASNTWILPVSFSVNQTCLLSGVAAMLGQNGLACGTLADDPVIGDGYDVGLRRERRADVTVFAVGRENRHARPVGNDDPRLFLVGRAVEHRDVVLAAHGAQTSLPSVGKERLVRRAPDIGDVLYIIGRGIDEVRPHSSRWRQPRGCGDRAKIPCRAPAVGPCKAG